VNQKFTGQERAAETGLDFFQARYYACGVMRFNNSGQTSAFAFGRLQLGWNGGVSGLSPTGEVKAMGLGLGAGLLGGFSGGVSATNYTNPLQLGKFAAFTPADFLLYAARQLCN
jgi:hypothetical protein